MVSKILEDQNLPSEKGSKDKQISLSTGKQEAEPQLAHEVLGKLPESGGHSNGDEQPQVATPDPEPSLQVLLPTWKLVVVTAWYTDFHQTHCSSLGLTPISA